MCAETSSGAHPTQTNYRNERTCEFPIRVEPTTEHDTFMSDDDVTTFPSL